MQFLIYLVSPFFYTLLLHPFHVSVCDLYFNQASQSLEITHRIFLDDLENALKEVHGRKINILKIAEEPEYETLVAAYLEEHFTIHIDGKTYDPEYLGYEVQDDAMWCYQEVSGVANLTEVTVRNTILMELFDDQTNIVHVKKGQKTRSLRLYEKNRKGSVIFK